MNQYYDNMLITNFDTIVLSCIAMDGVYHLTLEETAFYPEKGGMAKDVGTLNDMQVLDLYEKDGQVIHVLKEPFDIGTRVHGEIDALWRLRKCQIHTAQHILSYYLESHYPMMTISHHVSEHSADIRFEWQTHEDQEIADQLESIDMNTLKNEINDYANEIIRKSVDINICYPDYEEFRSFQKKTNFGPEDEVRVVKLGDEDYNFCGCIHVPNTSYIQMIHVYDIIITKTGLTLQYQAGDLLRLDHDKRIALMKDAGVSLKLNEFELMKGIETLQRQKQELENKLYLANQRCLELYFEALMDKEEEILVAEFDSFTTKEGQILASKLTAENKIVYLILKQEQNCHVIFASPKGSLHNMKEDYDRFAKVHQFRGGGNANMAQGGGMYSISLIEKIRALAQERKHLNDTEKL